MQTVPSPSQRFTPRLVFGLAVIAAGTLLTLENMEIIRIRHLWDYWPVVLILMGLTKAAGGRGTGRAVGLAMAAVGTLLLLDNLDYIRFHLWDLWPVALILIGISMVLGVLTRGRTAAHGVSSGQRVDGFAFLGRIQRGCNSPDFRGGDLTAVMGNCEVDLRTASITSGEAVIDTFAWWGNIEFKVPADWSVVLHGTPLLGSYEDHTQRPAVPSKTLVIRGMAIMANVEITN